VLERDSQVTQTAHTSRVIALAASLCFGAWLQAQETPRPNRHPLLSILPEPLPDGRASIAADGASQFLRPDFETARGGATFARFDGEDYGLALDYAKRLGPVALSLRLRAAWRSSGFTDQIFASWHGFLGTPMGGRDKAPRFRLDYTLKINGQTIAHLAEDRASLMDADLAMLVPFGNDAGGGRVGASVQIPTGRRDDFSGSGSWDWLVGTALWKRLGAFRLHTQLECAFLGVGDDNPYSLAMVKRTQKRAWAGVACIGGGGGFFDGLGLDISVAYAESPYSIGVPRIDSPSWQQHWTFSHTRLPMWRMGITEEAGTYFSPDLTVYILYRM